MDSKFLEQNFADLTQIIIANNLNVHGVQLYKEGTVLQTFGDVTTRYPIYSATKTILSLAVGIVLEQGKLDLNDSILEYLPDNYIKPLSPIQKEKFENITIERLLTMSVKGFPFRPEGDDWISFCLNQNIGDRPLFNYSNICSYLISVALTHVLGISSFDFIDSNIFSPLEIPTPIHSKSPEGYFIGSSSIELSVQELSKIGMLLMNGGQFSKKQIVSQKYIQQATSVQIMNKEGGYGYFIWKFLDGFSINGKWGQKCYCIPQENVMLTYLSDLQESSGMLKNQVINLFENK